MIEGNPGTIISRARIRRGGGVRQQEEGRQGKSTLDADGS